MRTVACWFLGALVAAFAQAKPQVVKTVFPTRDVVVAEEVLTPPAALATDAAPLIQAALDRASSAGRGTVFLPAGSYTIASRIVVREGVTLRGDLSFADVPGGTVLRLVADRGSEEAPATFSVERGAGLVGLAFWYPEQRLPDPVPYPWTVKNAQMGANDNQTVADCVFVNAWRALCIGPDGSELHTFRNVRICALRMGLSVDTVTDIGRVSDVEVSPAAWCASGLAGAPQESALRAYLLANDTVGADYGRSDWEYIWRLKVDGYRRGLVFRKGVRGTTNAVVAESDVRGCGDALDVSSLNQVGLSAYRCAFAGSRHAFLGEPSFDAVVQAHTCRFEGGVASSGSGVATFLGCELAKGRLDFSAGQLVALDSSLGEVALGAEVRRARLLGFDEKSAKIAHAATNGDVLVCAQSPGTVEAHAAVSPEPMAFARPVSGALFVVTDFGASPTNADNAAAFQAALNAAGRNAGGGTVYVPAGLYAFRGGLAVPSGVELRGCFDVPHHTVSAGSVLLVYPGRGVEDGAPFVGLKENSGLRGLTFWYPEQPLKEPVPYPWTVRSLGKGCWLTDVTIGNAWQGVDFGSHRSDGHRISYLAGSMYRRGLFVGDCKGKGWVEDVQFNPHYAARLPKGLPRTEGTPRGDIGHFIIQFQREKLEGLVFRDCRDEQVRGTFLYAAYDGIAFRGACRAQVLSHGSDACSRSASFELRRGSRVDFALAQLVTLGDWAKATVVTTPACRGEVRFFNTQMWAGPMTAVLEGSGLVRLEQFNTLTGPVEVRAGRLEAVGGVFDRSLPEHVAVSASAEAEVSASLCEGGPLRVSGDRVRVRRWANSASARQTRFGEAGAATRWKTSFEAGEPAAAVDTVAAHGGIRKVTGNRCAAVAREDAHGGARAVWLRGVSEDPAYSFVYQLIAEPGVTVQSDTALRYWIKPLDEGGRLAAIDLTFSNGKALRESGVRDSSGLGAHPGATRGAVGAWTLVEVPLGRFAGLRVESVMAAYDTRKGGGAFGALFDDIEIAGELEPADWQVRAEPAGGRVARKSAFTLAGATPGRVLYTLDGTDPTAGSAVYGQPVALARRGTVEVRYAPLRGDGTPSKQVFAELYWVE